MSKSMSKPQQPTEPEASPAGIGRRSVIQGLLAGAGASLAAGPALAESHPMAAHAHTPGRLAAARARAAGDGAPELLDPAQLAALDSLGERIVPGARAAGCALFIDSLLAVGDPEDARRFMSALGAIDAEARQRFGAPWSDLEEARQVELLEAAASGAPGRTPPKAWEPGTPVADHLAAQGRAWAEPARVTLRDHFEEIKGWVVRAYYSSEAGQWDLGWNGSSFGAPFQPCAHPGGHRD